MTDTEQVNFLFNGDSRYEEERFMELGDALQRLFDQDPDRLFDVTNWDFFEKTGFTTDHLYHLEGQLLSSMWAHKQKHLNPMFVLRYTSVGELPMKSVLNLITERSIKINQIDIVLVSKESIILNLVCDLSDMKVQGEIVGLDIHQFVNNVLQDESLERKLIIEMFKHQIDEVVEWRQLSHILYRDFEENPNQYKKRIKSLYQTTNKKMRDYFKIDQDYIDRNKSGLFRKL
ncbi:hypothetical protein CO174_00795 [Candidatus Uhrbacteria bacterium CG_4_9_14_3_um_filter_50_9]|uniref:Uncharacterized protein n=1 Tax=Candidatus Uhrbacteria bacterium CG_4_9_14_3_um_filter_50_9 TaxID=1975035 RepID=A0A2M7XE73_9BACT|nr:MAG: hypothetical protein CO174_00795 [Candidatus Uhrbacteria bacterium CG_4_9_14_3_um_filter_50_9]